MKKIQLLLMFILLFCLASFAQEKVTGKVTDLEGSPLSGVNVSIKGKYQGIKTNQEGMYTIDNVQKKDVLVFSYVGFKTVEKMVLTQSKINVSLSHDDLKIDEVVVVGYDVVKKEDLTGSVAVVNVDALKEAPISNFDEALAGRVAGVQVTSTDATPGSPLNIVVRGGNSITGDNSPLYVVDGIPLEDFDPSTLNTRDIKDFSILKDASATAIYGARGANGVIVITTIGGRTDGKTDIIFNTSTRFQTIMNRLEVMNPYEYVTYLEKIAYANDNYTPGTNVSLFHRRWVDPELYKDMEGTNWQDEIFRTANTNNQSLTLRTGNKRTTLLYSGNYLTQQGTLINSGFRKINNRLKFTHKIIDNLELNGQFEYTNTNTNGMQVSGTQYSSVIKNAVSYRPVGPITSMKDEEDEQDNLDDYEEDIIANDGYLFDPVKTITNTDRESKLNFLSGNLGINYKFLKKFDLSLNGNYRTNIRESTLFYGKDTQEAQRTNRGVNGYLSNDKTDIFSTSNTLRYKDKRGKHDFGGLLGFEAQTRTSKSHQLRNTNLPTDIFGMDNLSIATTATIATTNSSKNALLSFFGRLNYGYSDRYLATVNFRADGSSKFARSNRWGYFPSFSFAWRVSKEEFMKSIDHVVTDLKFRGGWGATGNNRIGDFDAFNLFAVTSSSGYMLGENQTFVAGAYQSKMSVPDLRWESTEQMNIGVDLQLWKRLSVTIDRYEKNTKDLLLNADMALSTGFATVQQNVGSVSNRGWEFSIESQNIRSKNFRWQTDFNISFNRTKTLELNRGQVEILTDPGWDLNFQQTEYQYVTRVGQPVGMIYGFEFDGLYQLDDFNYSNGTYTLKEGIPAYKSTIRPGMVKFKDTNGDGAVDQQDRVIIGNPHPKHEGGMYNTFRYKSFDLQVFFQWVYDFDILNGNKAQFGSIFRTQRNGFKSLNNFWTPENTDTDIAGMRFDGVNLTTAFGYKLDSRHIDDASYLKLKTLVLGYNLPDKLLSRIHVKKCRLSVSAQNIYTWTNYEGYDPDVSIGRYGALTPRLDYSAYPQSLTISGGLELTF